MGAITAGAAGVILLAGCGTRGDPLPPVYPNPPAITGLTVAQRGADAILRFPMPQRAVQVGAEDVVLDSVEVLLYAERYPVLDLDALVAGLERRRDVMIEDGLAAAAARERAAAQREAAAAAGGAASAQGGRGGAAGQGARGGAGGETAVATTTPGAAPGVRARSRNEDLIYRTPPALLQRWEDEELTNEAVLDGAARLATAVDTLWQRLGLPQTLLDPTEPLALPDPGDIATSATEILAPAAHERQILVGQFVSRAAVSRSVPYEQLEALRVGDLLQVAIPVGAPAPGSLRTRYFFAVRGRSERGTPGEVSAVAALAPAAVPVAPANVEATVGSAGVELAWEPPSGDLMVQRIDPQTLRYNIYRKVPGEPAPPTPINRFPQLATRYVDSGIQWGSIYVYEVRAVSPLPGTIVRESESGFSLPVEAVDIFPPAPPTALRVTRAETRVTLQWTPSTSIDLIGYRVYRHTFPAPPVPERVDPSAAGGAAGGQAGQAGQEATQEANPMVEAGWEPLSADPVPFSRYTDGTAEAGVRYVYAVQAVDAAGNLSAVAVQAESGNGPR